ncbi:HTH_Tnp_Tc3_2 domain-containing protein [Trichonephila clavipes]|nr:HTH_Tnp_Tc3_2 domain-containing protein [Trichonephila clavipes]
MDRGRFQRHAGSGRPRPTADWGDRLMVRLAFTAPDSSLSTIRRVTSTRVSTMTIYRRLIEQNLRSYRPLYHLPFTPARCRDRLQRCLTLSGWNHTDCGDVYCLATNSASNCVVKIIEKLSGDAQDSKPILLSLLHVTQALNQELRSGVPFF